MPEAKAAYTGLYTYSNVFIEAWGGFISPVMIIMVGLKVLDMLFNFTAPLIAASCHVN